MAASDDAAIWPKRYWHTWEPIVGPSYATALTKLKAWSNAATTILYVAAIVMLVYYFLFLRSGTLLIATVILLVPWAAVVFGIEFRRRRLAQTLQRNLAAAGKPVAELPAFIDVQFLRWKRDHSVTTEELESSAPK